MKLNLSKLLPSEPECEVLALGEQSWEQAVRLLTKRKNLRVSFVDPAPTESAKTTLLRCLAALSGRKWNILQENLTNFWWAHKSIADPSGTHLVLLGEHDDIRYRFMQALNYLKSNDEGTRYLCGTGELPDDLRDHVFTGSVGGWLVVIRNGEVVPSPREEVTA